MLARRDPDRLTLSSNNESELTNRHEYANTYWAGDDQKDLSRHLATLYRRRWWAFGVLTLALATAVSYLAVATPVYQARVKLLIESQTPNVVSFKEVLDQNTEKMDYYETQLGILRSRTLARKVLDRLALWSNPEFRHAPTLLRRLVAAVLPDATSVSEAKPFDPRVSSETAAQSHIIDMFLDRVTISYRGDNRLVDVGFASADPQLAADVANTLGRAYIEQNLDLKLRAVKEASDFLNARLVEQRKQVEVSERALQRYSEQNADLSLSEGQNVTVQKLAELTTASTRAKTEQFETESLYKQLQTLQEGRAGSDALPVIQANSFIQQLKSELASLQRDEARLSQRLGGRHPALVSVRSSIQGVEQQLRTEIALVAESVRNQLSVLGERERNLSDALLAQERVALELNRRAIRYRVLEREVASNHQIFDALLERAKQMQISSELKVTNIQVVDPAEAPELPASPRPTLILLVAVLVGLPLAAATAVGVEYLDDRIKSPDDIKSNLGLRFLGFAPAVHWNSATANISVNGPPATFAEALRTIRANLFMCTASQGAKSLLITSTGPNEGKTVVASNLAVALAQAGRRVLLIDADMRRRRIHEIFDEPLEPGLSAVLEGSIPIAEALRESKIPGLSILTAGAAATSPGDLLERPLMREAVASVGHQFDWIVIDSPPVMVASDAISLAHVATGVVFVIGSEMTSRRDARTALEQLVAAQPNIIGAVLSRANMYLPYYQRRYRAYRSRG